MPRSKKVIESVEQEPVEVEESNSPTIVDTARVAKKVRKNRKKKKVEVIDSEPEDDPVPVPKKRGRKKKVRVEEVKEVIKEEITDVPVVKAKRTRKPSSYNNFVSSSMKTEAIKKLPPKQRFKAVAELWKKEKSKSANK